MAVEVIESQISTDNPNIEYARTNIKSLKAFTEKVGTSSSIRKRIASLEEKLNGNVKKENEN